MDGAEIRISTDTGNEVIITPFLFHNSSCLLGENTDLLMAVLQKQGKRSEEENIQSPCYSLSHLSCLCRRGNIKTYCVGQHTNETAWTVACRITIGKQDFPDPLTSLPFEAKEVWMTYIFPVQLYHKLTAVEPFTLSQTLHILSGFAMEFVFPVVPFPTCTVFPKTGSNSCSQNILWTIMEEFLIHK